VGVAREPRTVKRTTQARAAAWSRRPHRPSMRLSRGRGAAAPLRPDARHRCIGTTSRSASSPSVEPKHRRRRNEARGAARTIPSRPLPAGDCARGDRERDRGAPASERPRGAYAKRPERIGRRHRCSSSGASAWLGPLATPASVGQRARKWRGMGLGDALAGVEWCSECLALCLRDRELTQWSPPSMKSRAPGVVALAIG
jgi:hypothetical protein